MGGIKAVLSTAYHSTKLTFECQSERWEFRKPDSKIKQRMLSVSILESNWYISFSSHRITTTGIDCKTKKEKRYLQRERVFTN